MCGLVGIGGDLSLKDEKIIQCLLLWDYFRGTDSTGLAAIRKTGEPVIAKIASHPLDFFDTGKFKTANSAYSSQAFIGHNRAATRGVVNAVNAHPFTYGDITGAHNGTLDVSCVRKLEEELGETFTVDSMAIFAAIDKFGVEKAVGMLEGAWALVWFDKKDGSLNFLRNDKRPLWYAYSADFKKVFWASEYLHINSAVKQIIPDFPFFTETNKDTGSEAAFFKIEENVHYRFDLKELAKGSETRPKPRAKEIKGKEPAPVTSNGNFPKSGGGSSTGWTRTHRTTHQTTTSLGTTTTRKPEVVTLTANANNPFGGAVDMTAFRYMVKDGCSYCSAPIDETDEGVTVFIEAQRVHCPECSVSNKTRVYVKDINSILQLPQIITIQ